MLRRINDDDDDEDDDDDSEDDDDGDDDDDDDGDDDEGGGRRMIMICPEPRTTLCVAVEMHFNMSQEPLCTDFTRKMSRPRMSPECRHTLCASPRSRIQGNTSQKKPLYTDS